MIPNAPQNVPVRRNRKTLMKQFLGSFAQNLCNVQKTCEDIKIPRAIYMEWIETSPSFLGACEAIRGQIIDKCEANLLDGIEKGDIALSKYWLEHQSDRWKAPKIPGKMDGGNFKIEIERQNINPKPTDK
jgi:hypothetical protein